MLVMKQRIPKKIHYVWVGKGKKNELMLRCIESWKKFCPDWEIIEWNEDNYDIESNDFVSKALKAKNWALASDVIRIDVVEKYGGVYFDTDMELVKPIDEFLSNDAFFVMENNIWLATCAFGAVAGHEMIKTILKRYMGECVIDFNTNPLTVHSFTYVLRKLYGIKLNGKTIRLEDKNITIYQTEYFTPQDYMTFELKMTDNTVAIHRYTSTWHNKKQQSAASFAKNARKVLGRHIFSVFERTVHNSYMNTLKNEYKTMDKTDKEIQRRKDTTNIIEVKKLCKTYGEVKAVKNISFNVKRGSFIAFLGQNGAGKSTTINMICSILSKDSGKIFIDGLDADKHKLEVKKKIGIVFQNSVLDAYLTVSQNLYSRASIYNLNKKQAKKRIDYLISLLDFEDLLDRKYMALSGGEKRRIDIARSLLHDPQILFLDEPTTGLDPKTRIIVWDIIEKLRTENNLTIFLTTHYMEEVVRADDVIIINKGKIVASGTPIELKNKYSKDSVRVIKETDKEFEELLNKEGFEFDHRNNSYYVYVKNSDHAFEFIKKHKNEIDDFEVLKGDMDDVFLSVTGQLLKETADNE